MAQKIYFPFDKEEYFQIARTQNLQIALSALHKKIDEMESTLFQGDVKEIESKLLELDSVRSFARDLWSYAPSPNS